MLYSAKTGLQFFKSLDNMTENTLKFKLTKVKKSLSPFAWHIQAHLKFLSTTAYLFLMDTSIRRKCHPLHWTVTKPQARFCSVFEMQIALYKASEQNIDRL